MLRRLRRQLILGRRMSLLQRFHRWTQQSARIYEATMLIIVHSIIRLIFGPGGLLMVMVSPDVTITNAECLEAFRRRPSAHVQLHLLDLLCSDTGMGSS